jgi:hypothetical protein
MEFELSAGECATIVAALDLFKEKLLGDPDTVKHDPEHIEEVSRLREVIATGQ